MAKNVTAITDITNMTSGSLYVIAGSYSNTVTINVTMSGPGQPDLNVTTTISGHGNNNRLWSSEFQFTNSDLLYTTLTYNYDSPALNRCRYMGCILDGEVSGAPSTPTPLQLAISPTSGSNDSFDFSWESTTGKVYDLVSSTTLDTDPATWPVWENNSNISANSLTGVPSNGDPKRFFVILEKNAPPAP